MCLRCCSGSNASSLLHNFRGDELTSQPLAMAYPQYNRGMQPSLNLALLPLSLFHSHYRGITHAYAAYDPHTAEQPSKYHSLAALVALVRTYNTWVCMTGKSGPILQQDRLCRWKLKSKMTVT